MIIETVTAISLSVWLGKKIADKGFDLAFEKLVSSDKINNKFYKAVNSTSTKLQKKYPDLLGGSIDFFFKEESIFSELTKLLFKSSKVDINLISDNFDVDSLPDGFILEFVTELKTELIKDQDFDEIFSDKELFIAIQGIGSDIDVIAKNSNITKRDIEKISEIIEARIGKIFSYKDFHKEYSEKAYNNLSQVNFLGLGVDISIPRTTKMLKDIFVKPNFILLNKKFRKKNEQKSRELRFEDELQPMAYKDLLNHHPRLVILGNPGSGKSVLVKAIMCSILKEETSEFTEKKITSFLPLRIELRKYLSYKKENRGNILKYMTVMLEEEYGIYNTTKQILDNILKEQNCIIFFDGLDEIFKIKDKIEIKNDIENFHISYNNLLSLTTSRIIGYEEASFNNDYFCELMIQKFNDDQVNEYVRKWYEKEEENEEIRDSEVRGFIDKKNEIDDELITNPLLLSLIVILYRNILKLPESKLEIYQSCTKTLVDKWDASKELEIDLEPKIYKEKEKIFADLAYWQYDQFSSDKTKITYDKARKTVAKTLVDKLKFPDDHNLIDLAEGFMSYAKKRSIYFDNNFTHKTFLEYYTAYWIYSNIEKKHKAEERDKLIGKYINTPFWFIVLELLLNLIDKDQPDDDIIDGIIEKQLSTTKSIPFFLTAIHNLQNVSDNKITELVNKSIQNLLDKKSKENNKLKNKIFEGLQKLYFLNGNFKNHILDRFNEIASKPINDPELFYSLYIELLSFGMFRRNKKTHFDLKDSSLFQKAKNNSPYLYILDCYTYDINNKADDYFGTINEFMDLFGVPYLFKSFRSQFDRIRFGPFIYYYLHRQITPESIGKIAKNLDSLEKKGLSKNALIKQLTDSRTSFGYGNDRLKTIVDRFSRESDPQICAILLLLLVRSFDRPYIYGKEKIMKLNELAKGSKKQKELLEIHSLKKIEKKVDYILKNYGRQQ